MAEQCTHLDQIHESNRARPQVARSASRRMGGGSIFASASTAGTSAAAMTRGASMTKHFHQSRHPIIKSPEPSEDWAWCYVDEVVMEPAAAAP